MTLLQKSPQRSHDEQFKQTGPLLVIVGQTASGKSALAMRLAEEFDGEIICADSRTMYKSMDIGTAKPTKSEQKNVRHHLLDTADPSEKISAYDFVQLSKKALLDIWSRNKLPIVVGGSGMYVDALIFGYTFRDNTSESNQYTLMNLTQLQTLVKQKYGDRVTEEDYKNRRRMQALMERGVAIDTDRDSLKFQCLILGLDTPDESLKERIRQRTQGMFADGFVGEVKRLLKRYSPSAPGLLSTGYREVIAGLKAGLNDDELAKSVERATWQLARKQRTWFRRNKYIRWVDSPDLATREVSIYLKRSKLQ